MYIVERGKISFGLVD